MPEAGLPYRWPCLPHHPGRPDNPARRRGTRSRHRVYSDLRLRRWLSRFRRLQRLRRFRYVCLERPPMIFIEAVDSKLSGSGACINSGIQRFVTLPGLDPFGATVAFHDFDDELLGNQLLAEFLRYLIEMDIARRERSIALLGGAVELQPAVEFALEHAC